MPSKQKRPRDPAQLAKLIVDIATGEVEDSAPVKENKAAKEFGRKGGQARAEKTEPDRRSEIARTAARKRWEKR